MKKWLLVNVNCYDDKKHKTLIRINCNTDSVELFTVALSEAILQLGKLEEEK